MSGGYFGFTHGGSHYSYGSPGPYGMNYSAQASPSFGYSGTPSGYSGGVQSSSSRAEGLNSNSCYPYGPRSDNLGYYSSPVPPVTGFTKAAVNVSPALLPTFKGQATNSARYDAVVYATTNNFIQSRAPSTGSQWLGLRKNAAAAVPQGRVMFPRKMPGVVPRAMQLHYCEVCKISCAGPQTYREHLEGQKHKKKEVQMRAGSQPVAKTKATLRCDLCGVTCTGQDTYQAHVKGAKHQKTLKLHQTLGKPIPSSEPTIIPPTQSVKPAVATSAVKTETDSTATGDPATNIAAAAAAAPNASDSTSPAVGRNQVTMLGLDKDVQPVGEDYIETLFSEEGKLAQYYCKLCDCRFNDLNAKEMHLKGRRHRLQYKKKVDPQLEVDFKPYPSGRGRPYYNDRMRKDGVKMRQSEPWNIRNAYGGVNARMSPSPVPLFGKMGPAGMSQIGNTGRFETVEERYLKQKDEMIQPTEQELSSVQKVVTNVEKALKGVSDVLTAEAAASAEKEPKEKEAVQNAPADAAVDQQKEQSAAAAAKTEERMLRGVMRVGNFAKGLLLRGSLSVRLVAMCSKIPTIKLLNRVLELLPDQLANFTEERYSMNASAENACITIASSTGDQCVFIELMFTSVLVREAAPPAAADSSATNSSPDNDDHHDDAHDDQSLDKQKCLEALAELRHAKWFQARCGSLPFSIPILRILGDMRLKSTVWYALPQWALELLIEKVLSSAGSFPTYRPSPVDLFRRVFEALAAGVALADGPGLLDPCEKEPVDALAPMTVQQREDVTLSAQQALRQIFFGQTYKLLGVEKMVREPPHTKKRQLEQNDETATSQGTPEVKKEKKEEKDVSASVMESLEAMETFEVATAEAANQLNGSVPTAQQQQ